MIQRVSRDTKHPSLMALLNLNHVTHMLIINGGYILFLSHPQCIYQLLNITHWPLLTSPPSSISGKFSESGKVKPARIKARIITSGNFQSWETETAQE